MKDITIQKHEINKQQGVVVLPLKEYEKLREQAVPAYYLSGKQARDLDALAKDGLREHKAGKTKEIESLADIA